MRELNFAVAFGVRSANTKEPLHDPSFAEFAPALIKTSATGVREVTPLAFHKCSDEDWELFSPSIAHQKLMMARAREHDFFYCLDRVD